VNSEGEIEMKDLEKSVKIAVFKGKEVRKVIFDNEWWFSVVDIVEVLTDSTNPRDYWYRLKKRELDKSGVELSTFCRQLRFQSSDSKYYATDAVNTENAFRIIQSIPSPKAEPFKRWLAKVGYERVQEIEDPELATKRTRALYKAKGYSDAWIEKRMRGIAIREELTDEWKNRGAKEEREYSILTAEISKAAFGMTPSEYKEYKGLNRENLRDHFSDLELIFNMLGEASTTEITKNRDVKGYPELKKAAHNGGDIAGNARKALEKKSGKKVSTRQNYKEIPEREMRKNIGKNDDEQ
jgi:DNA-damage-inducible protein D